MSWKATAELSNMIKHYANFPATGVSLRQMYGSDVRMIRALSELTCDQGAVRHEPVIR
jgi:hypothetical protein